MNVGKAWVLIAETLALPWRGSIRTSSYVNKVAEIIIPL